MCFLAQMSAASTWTWGIANIINVINPDLILLGGWSGLLFAESYLAQIKEVVARYALSQSLANTSIQPCQLGQDSVALGAASLLLDNFFQTAGESDKMVIGGEPVRISIVE